MRIVAIRARRLPGLRKLAGVGFSVTILTNLRGALELHRFLAHGHFVTSATIYSSMRPQQREFGLCMVKSVDVRPRPHTVACLASQRCAVGALLGHAIFEFAVMRICVAGGATAVLEAERHNLVGAARRSRLMAIGARHGGVRSRQSESGLAMLRDGKECTVKIAHCMAILAFVQVWGGGELAVMSILVTVCAERKLHLVNRVLAGRKMALGAFDRDVLPFQGIARRVVFLHAE